MTPKEIWELTTLYSNIVRSEVQEALMNGATKENWKDFMAGKHGLKDIEEYEEYLWELTLHLAKKTEAYYD